MLDQMSPAQLRQRLDAGDKLVILDVRQPEEWAIARLEGATLIPLGELGSRISELDPEAETVVLCHHGIRSMQAALYLDSQDFANVHNLSGGIDAWSMTVDPATPRY